MIDKKLEVVFDPGCFDSFETQEDLDAFVAEIHRLINSGELLELDDLEEVDMEEFDQQLVHPRVLQ